MSEAPTQTAPTVTPTSSGGVSASFSMVPSAGASKMDTAPTVAQMAAAKRAPTAPGSQPTDLAPAKATVQSESHLSQDQLSTLYGDEEGGDTTTQTNGDQPELIMGRYKNTEELVEAYKNLQRHKGVEVPESYDLSDTGLKDTGISGLAQSDPFYAEVQGDLKAANVTADQLPALAKIMSKWQRTQASKNGPATDLKTEEVLLRKEWGDSYESRGREIADWAKDNINGTVWQTLARTSEGMKFLDSIYRKAERGTAPIANKSAPVSVSKDDLNIELGRLMNHPAYYQNSAEGKAIHAKVDKIYSRLATMK